MGLTKAFIKHNIALTESLVLNRQLQGTVSLCCGAVFPLCGTYPSQGWILGGSFSPIPADTHGHGMGSEHLHRLYFSCTEGYQTTEDRRRPSKQNTGASVDICVFCTTLNGLITTSLWHHVDWEAAVYDSTKTFQQAWLCKWAQHQEGAGLSEPFGRWSGASQQFPHK